MPPTMGVGTHGNLTTRDERSPVTYSDCERDRWQLANQDDPRYFRDILQQAERANATFYTIDPRGLPAFDSDLGDTPLTATTITPPSIDAAILGARLDSLRVLANNTDGMAVLNNNDIGTGLQKVVADLTSYYLLGLLLDEPEAGREVPPHRGQDRPARRRRARPARIPRAVGRGDGGGHDGPRGAHAGVGGARRGGLGDRAPGPASARHRALGRGGAARAPAPRRICASSARCRSGWRGATRGARAARRR